MITRQFARFESQRHWAKRLFRNYLIAQFQPAARGVVLRRLKRIGIILLAILALWILGFAIVRTWPMVEGQENQSRWYVAPTENSRGLVVIVHGWTKGPENMEQVAEVVKDEFGDHSIYLWGYESDTLSNKNPLGLSMDLANWIAQFDQETQGEVVLIGHSLGGLLVRRAFLTGLEAEMEWSKRVSRIVLLAAPNRGTRAISRSRGLWVINALVRSYGVGELARSTYRGAPFIVNLRIDWIRRFQKLENPPLVAQILGSDDGVVNSSDSIDILQFPNSMNIVLPNSTHASVVNKDESGASIQQVLHAPQAFSSETQVYGGTAAVKVLIVHGIRDYGERFDEIRDEINSKTAQLGIQLKAIAPRYKYFSALQFINPFSRQQKVYEFADMYTEMLAAPPVDAPIHFVGHSFGTYLMGESTIMYDSIDFERVYLAGSVLHERFFVEHDVLGKRIQYVRNDIATSDWPVGILCSAINGLALGKDVGTGGFNGFLGIVQEDRYEEIKYFDGGHGKALEPKNRPTIAAWLLQGSGDSYDPTDVNDLLERTEVLTDNRGYLWNLASRAAPGIFVLLLAMIVYLVLVGQKPIIAAGEIVVLMWFLNII